MSEQEFQSKLLNQLERIEQGMGNLDNRLNTINLDVKKSHQRLDSLLSNLPAALVATVISVSLFIPARNAFEL